MITIEQAFRAGFMYRCAELGLSEEQLTKMAEESQLGSTVDPYIEPDYSTLLPAEKSQAFNDLLFSSEASGLGKLITATRAIDAANRKKNIQPDPEATGTGYLTRHNIQRLMAANKLPVSDQFTLQDWQNLYAAPAAVKQAADEPAEAPSERPAKKKKPKSQSGKPSALSQGVGTAISSLPLAVTGLGAGAYGLARGLGTKEHLDKTVAGFKQMDQPLPENTTILTQYADSMNPGTSSSFFGIPFHKFGPWFRSKPLLMGAPAKPGEEPSKIFDIEGWSQLPASSWRKAIADKIKGDPELSKLAPHLMYGANVPGYVANTPELLHGARAHYEAFSRGPVAAVSHMMRGPRAPYALADAKGPVNLPGSTPGMNYNQYFTPKFERFIQNATAQQMLPNEFTLDYMPREQQMELLRKFHASLTPEERAVKEYVENEQMLGLKEVNTRNYYPAALAASKGHSALQRGGQLAVGTGVGGLLGNLLYNRMVSEKKRGNLSRALAVLAGSGLGGAAAYRWGDKAQDAVAAGAKRVGSGLSSLLSSAASKLQPSGKFIWNPGIGEIVKGIQSRPSLPVRIPF